MGTTASKGSREGFSAPPERTPTNMQDGRKPHDVVQQTLADQKGSKPGKDAGGESGEKKQSSTTREKLQELFEKRIGSHQEVGTTSTPEIPQKKDLTKSTEDLSTQPSSESVRGPNKFSKIIEDFEKRNALKPEGKDILANLRKALAPEIAIQENAEKMRNRLQEIEKHIQSSTDKRPKEKEREN